MLPVTTQVPMIRFIRSWNASEKTACFVHNTTRTLGRYLNRLFAQEQLLLVISGDECWSSGWNNNVKLRAPWLDLGFWSWNHEEGDLKNIFVI